LYFTEHIIIGIAASLLVWVASQNNSYAIVAFVGSILPDLIDKPIGYLFYTSGRNVAHSIIIISLACLIVYLWLKHNRVQIGILYFALLEHHVADGMWEWRSLWFYPLFGDKIPRTGTIDIAGCINKLEWCYQTEITHLNNYILIAISGLTLIYIMYYLWRVET
jgi:hypothetical protein